MNQNNTNQGRDQYIFNQSGPISITPSMEIKRDRILQTLLTSVEREVRERLVQSLHRAVHNTMLNLGKVLEPQQISCPWSLSVTIQAQPQPVKSDITIAQVFEQKDVAQKLLILGEPGSGKTTTMLELAQHLVTQAQAIADAPIPVLVNLSGWNTQSTSIFEWLVLELNAKYGVRKDLGKDWLSQKQLLPLLDGLDEVAPSQQKSCALALNEWLTGDLTQQPVGVGVCCRQQEYEQIVRQRLFLQNAVVLQPLSTEQIQQYLRQFELNHIWETAQYSQSLQTLLQKPLFLSIFGLVAVKGRFDTQAWQQLTTETERHEYLFDQYWDIVMGRPLTNTKEQQQGILSRTYAKERPPNWRVVRRALMFAAQAMEQESNTEWLIEQLQPAWLMNQNQKRCYEIISGLIFGIISGLIIWFILNYTLGIIFGIISGLIFSKENIKTVEAINFSMSKKTKKELIKSIRRQLIGMAIGMLIGGWIGGLSLGIIGGFIGETEIDIKTHIYPNQGIKNSLNNTIFIGIISLFLILPFTLITGILITLIIGEKIVFNLVPIFLVTLIWSNLAAGGGYVFIQHTILRIILAWNGYAPYRYDLLLDYCTERLLLQRIGGRYRFMHKLLQEHFAKMN